MIPWFPRDFSIGYVVSNLYTSFNFYLRLMWMSWVSFIIVIATRGQFFNHFPPQQLPDIMFVCICQKTHRNNVFNALDYTRYWINIMTYYGNTNVHRCGKTFRLCLPNNLTKTIFFFFVMKWQRNSFFSLFMR